MKFPFKLISLMFLEWSSCNTLRAQWVEVNTPIVGSVYCFAVSGNTLFVGTGGDGVLLTTDNGRLWTRVNEGLANLNIWTLAMKDTNLFAATANGVFRSTNNGSSWTEVDTGLKDRVVTCFAVRDSSLFAGNNHGVFRSTDNGATWAAASTGLTDSLVRSLMVSSRYLFAGTYYTGVFRSTDDGLSWQPFNAGLTKWELCVEAIAVCDTNVFAGTPVGVFRSTLNGTSWKAAGLDGSTVMCFAVSDTDIFVGTGQNGLFLSSNNGATWTPEDIGMPPPYSNLQIDALAVRRSLLFAGGGMLWKRPLWEMTTSVGTRSTQLPNHFILRQNYPNPFNPSTTISFSLPSSSFVTLQVFDVLGREVSTLMSRKLSAGTYSQKWNASDLPSGVYFYRLQAGEFAETRKLQLLK